MTNDELEYLANANAFGPKQFTQPWPERIKEVRQRGEMIGMLQGVKDQLDDATRDKIEKFLEALKE